jgi:CheY-like chemotaxis protein
VLLIEDHDMTRDMLSRLLTRHGHEVGCAASGARARQAAREREFDVVISDLGLPDCDGHLLMMELRGAYGLSGIALSGYGMERDIQRSLESGFFLHLTKPVEMEVLLQALAEVPPPQR